MAKSITFRMAAWSDAAGKYDPNVPLNGNEDNFYVDDDLSDDIPSHIVADEDKMLSDCGLIMAVADGMGGMNAGEVASQIAHDTVAEYFAPGKIAPQLAQAHESRSRYMEEVIREADRRIKDDARHNRDHEGMGSTLIMAWLVGDELSVTWIGDSRAYRFNPQSGIEPLSKDHSYVQELADKGIITYEQTFEHPQGNIVTRSLGDGSQKAKPESRLFKLSDGDIILLCSDGLSGVLRDRKTYDENGELYEGENLEDIIREHSTSLSECREALWAAAERADWYDNVTAILCEIRSGAGAYTPAKGSMESKNADNPAKSKLHKTFDGFVIKIPRKRLVALIIVLFLIIAFIGGGLWYKLKKQEPNEIVIVQNDSTGLGKPDSMDTDSRRHNTPAQEVSGHPAAKNKKDMEPQKPNLEEKKGKPKEGVTPHPAPTPNVPSIIDSLIKKNIGNRDVLTPAGKNSELSPASNNKKKKQNGRDTTKRGD